MLPRLCAGWRLVLSLSLSLLAVSGQAGPVPLVARYHLTATDGRSVTERSFPGKWQLVFFGFTNCPEICSTALLTVKTALDELGPRAALVQPVFVTIDPAFDTSQRMARYLSNFGPQFIGLRGSDEETKAAVKAFRVYLQKRSISDDIYTLDHSTFLYLMHPDGTLARLLSADVPGHRLANQLRAELP
jgi:protein SCO1/2